MKSIRAEYVIEVIETFFACFGVPEEIVSDNGPPFSSEKFVMFLKSKGIKVSKLPTYHPQSNGLAKGRCERSKVH